MKLLCDGCENAVASLICCADEAALCSLCDSRVHAANKLASKHQRIPLLSEPSEPVLCDTCQERPAFFFCIEDRALLCRECDVSIHSSSVLAAKHRRFFLTHLQVGLKNCPSSPSLETTSAISSEQYMLDTASPSNGTAKAVKEVRKKAAITTTIKCQNDNGGLCNSREMSNGAANKSRKTSTAMTSSEGDRGIGSKEATEKASKALAPAAINAKAFRSYLMSKQGTFSNLDNADHRKDAVEKTSSNSTATIAIRRISGGGVPFVAPVLSTICSALTPEEASNNIHNQGNFFVDDNVRDNRNNSNSIDVTMDVDDCPPVQSDNASDYFVSGISGWRLDELLTDLVGICENGPSLSTSKESNALGFGIQEDPPWYAELDVMEEHDLSPSQGEGVALVPQMPSPPTASGLVTSRGRATCLAAQPWDFDYLFTDPHHSNEFSVVPDIDGCRSSPLFTASPTRNGIRKKRKVWLDV